MESTNLETGLDVTTLVARFGGNAATAKKVLAKFLPEAQKAADALAAALTQNDWAAVQHHAHKIAGGAKIIAAMPAGEAASAIEQALRDQLPELAVSSFPPFEKEFRRLFSEITAFLNEETSVL